MSRAGRGRMREVEVPVGVGGADQPVVLPRNDQQHRRVGPQDQPGVAGDLLARHHDVHALGRAHLEPAPPARQRLDLVGPDAGAVEHHAGANGRLAPVLGVAHAARRRPGRTRARSRSPGSRAGSPRRSGPRCARRSGCAGHRRPGRRSSVTAPMSASRRRPGNSRSAAARVRCFWPGTLLCPAHRVVERQTRGDVGRSQPRWVSG